jgi:hypothetical protein
VKYFDVKAGGEVVRCEFLPDASPLLRKVLEGLIPLNGELHCAKITGDEVFVIVPVTSPPVEEGVRVRNLAGGAIAYWPDRSLLSFLCDPPVQGVASLPLVGRVVGNLEGLRRIARLVGLKQGLRVEIVEASGPPPMRTEAEALDVKSVG